MRSGELLEGARAAGDRQQEGRAPITTQAGLAVVQFWLKLDSEPDYDYLFVMERQRHELGAHGLVLRAQLLVSRLGQDHRRLHSPGGSVQVRFRFESDEFCSSLEPVACGATYNGVRVDEVIVGAQAP